MIACANAKRISGLSAAVADLTAFRNQKARPRMDIPKKALKAAIGM